MHDCVQRRQSFPNISGIFCCCCLLTFFGAFISVRMFFLSLVILTLQYPRGYKMHFLMYFMAFPVCVCVVCDLSTTPSVGCLSASQCFWWGGRLVNRSVCLLLIKVHVNTWYMHITGYIYKRENVVFNTARIVFFGFAERNKTKTPPYLHARSI